MLKYFRSFLLISLISGLSTTLLANEWAAYYFPGTLGSTWVYEDKEGNEITRSAIAEENIQGETFRAFKYEPAIDDWEKYYYPIHPFLYQIGEKWVAFYVGDEVEKATKSILTKQLEETQALISQQIAEQLPPGFNIGLDYTVKPTAQDYFYLMPTPVTYNKEWVAMELEVKVGIKLDIQGAAFEIPQEYKTVTSNTKVVETGIVKGTENVETKAGKFEDCLIIEYRTKTTTDTNLSAEIRQMLPEQQTNESTTTLWLAPNVGIVKFENRHEKSDEIIEIELINYDIKPNEADSEENN